MVHENWRWQPAIVALREDITRGSIGKPFFAQVAGSFATSLRALLRLLLRAAVDDLPARKPIRYEPDVNPTPIFLYFNCSPTLAVVWSVLDFLSNLFQCVRIGVLSLTAAARPLHRGQRCVPASRAPVSVATALSCPETTRVTCRYASQPYLAEGPRFIIEDLGIREY